MNDVTDLDIDFLGSIVFISISNGLENFSFYFSTQSQYKCVFWKFVLLYLKKIYLKKIKFCNNFGKSGKLLDILLLLLYWNQY